MNASLQSIRSYLQATSLREADIGVPVGCILLKRDKAGQLKKLWHEQKLGKIGIKCFQEISECPEFAIVHVATHTAARICTLQRREGFERITDVLKEMDGTYYGGIRTNDSKLSGKPPHMLIPPGSERFTFGEIFSGIGGFRLGLEPLGGSCLFASEIDPDAEKTYAANFGTDELIGDITGHYAADLPPCDILTAGFPCQSFSVRGDQKGLDDPRGQLYLELVRVLSSMRPKAFIFENVANLVVIDGGKRGNYCNPPVPDRMGSTFAKILSDFTSIGYTIDWKIVNSRHWLPQNRERVYIIGFRNDLGVDPASEFDWNLNRLASIYNEGTGKGIKSTVRDILEPSDANDIQHCILTPSQHAKISSLEFLKKSFPVEAASGKLTGKENWINIDGKSPTLVSGYRNAASFSTKFVFHEPDGSLRDMPRFFTHMECKRIMGFPDEFKYPLSAQYNSFYKQLGNAVCPPVIHAIGSEVLKLLGEERTYVKNGDDNSGTNAKRIFSESILTTSPPTSSKRACPLPPLADEDDLV